MMWPELVGQASACLRCGEYEDKSRQARRGGPVLLKFLMESRQSE